MKKTIITLIITVFAISTQAQQRFSQYRHNSQSAGFRGVGLGIGGAFPSFDYYSDNTSYEFDFTPMAMLAAEFWVSKPFAVRLGGGYLSTNGTATDEETKVNQLSVSLDGIVHFTKTSRFSRKPQPSFYLGLGAEFVQLSVDYTPSSGTTQSLNGGTTLVRILAGLEYPITPQVKIGAELQYGIGKYEQGFATGTSESLEEISVSGVRGLLTLKYIFNDYTPRARRGRYR